MKRSTAAEEGGWRRRLGEKSLAEKHKRSLAWSPARELPLTPVGGAKGEGGEVKQAAHGFYSVQV